jgi:hypothetical protein
VLKHVEVTLEATSPAFTRDDSIERFCWLSLSKPTDDHTLRQAVAVARAMASRRVSKPTDDHTLRQAQGTVVLANREVD